MKYLTIREATRLLSVTRLTVKSWIEKGRLPSAKKDMTVHPPQWQIPANELEQVRREEIVKLEARLMKLAEPIV